MAEMHRIFSFDRPSGQLLKLAQNTLLHFQQQRRYVGRDCWGGLGLPGKNRLAQSQWTKSHLTQTNLATRPTFI